MPIMRLKSVKYEEHFGKPFEWKLDGLVLGNVNLLVGKNATGKTRTLNILANFAKMFVIDQKLRVQNAGYDLHFDYDGKDYQYVVRIFDGSVTHEDVVIDGINLLERSPGPGSSKIFFDDERKKIKFRPPKDEIAAVARQDSLQHPFLEPLHEWAGAVRHYTFGDTLGKGHVAIPVKGGPDVDDRDSNQVFGVFRKALAAFGKVFTNAVIHDMKEMGYELEDIVIVPAESFKLVRDGIPTDILVLGIREKGVSCVVDQNQMSQGMFRAMSILIQVNYSQMADRANCILIDDIGEGLDFDRSTKLIEILRSKALASSFQLVMSTNDQFVMNHVPLDEWSVLQRDGSIVRVKNHVNSKEQFEYFKFVGMSNFTFFEMDFANSPPKQEEAALAHE